MVTSPDLQALSDAQLDAAYAASFDAGDASTANVYAQEILTRLQGVGAFLYGAIGGTSFPLYNARGTFQQSTVATASISTSAGNLATGVGSAITSGLMAFGAGSTIVLIIAGAAVIWYVSSKKAG